MSKIRVRQPNHLWLRQRELGIKFPLGHTDRFHKTLYSSMQPIRSPCDVFSADAHGGVFNLEFSPNGSLLLAACEKKAIAMYDTMRRRIIHTVTNAHDDCVNCVRFLDDRMFATCSDDSTVALWDIRCLKHRIRTLHGHSNWVKNIEYSPQDNLILTSGFDGSIYTWDINSFTENSILYSRVFHTNGLMRTRLSPDTSKMLISTTSGYLIIIHDLNLSTLIQDLEGFRPNMYRLMQSSQTTFPNVRNFTHLFSHSRKNNRVEFISDFPDDNDAEIISSLQVHPQGWCALSRNVSCGEKSEWTCIHDIQEREKPSTPDQTKEDEEMIPQFDEESVQEIQRPQQPQPTPPIIRSVLIRGQNSNDRTLRASRSHPRSSRSDRNPMRTNFGPIEVNSGSSASNSRMSEDSDEIQRVRYIYANDLHTADENLLEEDWSDQERESSHMFRRPSQDFRALRRRSRRSYFPSHRFNSSSNIDLHVDPDLWEAQTTRNATRAGDGDESSQSTNHIVVIIDDRLSIQNLSRETQRSMFIIRRNPMIHENMSRLTHYIEEPNVGSGYIKELCFSTDGRLICSPFGFGVRLLAFSNDCAELPNCVPPYNQSMQLHELATNINHSGIVVSTKFSPRECMFVSGCLSGKVVWHQPVI